MKLYIDTNIIMDMYHDRNTSAAKLFIKAMNCRHELIISDVVLAELHFQSVNAEGFVKIMNSTKKLSIVLATPEDKILAKSINTHFNDALHYVITQRIRADALVTQNTKDFIHLPNIRIGNPDDF